jgi:hypothetical protein
MTQDEIIEMAKQVGEDWWADDLDLKAFASLVAQHERERIFGELLKMHEIASSRHNYYLNAVLTIKARGQA